MDTAATVATLKALTSAMRDANRLDLATQLIDLQQAMIELIATQSTLAAENADLRAKLDEVVQLVRQRDDFYFERNAYWRGDAEAQEGPFCARCLDVTGKVVRMLENTSGMGQCAECQAIARLTGSTKGKTTSARRALLPDWLNAWS